MVKPAVRNIIMSAAEADAVLDGTKTQARRLRWQRPMAYMSTGDGPPEAVDWIETVWHRLQPGDRLWIRETWRACPDCGAIDYRALRTDFCQGCGLVLAPQWRSPNAMPRRHSRGTIEVAELRRERLQAITEDDARAEGIRLPVTADGRPIVNISARHSPLHYREPDGPAWTFRAHFAAQWDEQHRQEGNRWRDDPEVFVIRFRRLEAAA